MIALNNQYHEHMSVDKLKKIIEECK
ncbi:MAG: hypothetical protein ACNI22_04765 [Halarcobacter sp.]